MAETLDWGNLVKDAGEATGGFTPLPDGKYNLVVTEAKAVKTQDGSKTMFKVKASVQGGPYNNRILFDNLVVSPENPNALGFFFRKMDALGIPREYFQRQPTPTTAEIEAVMLGRPFIGTVKGKEYKGELRNEISTYERIPVATTAATSPSPVAAAPAPVAPAPIAPAPIAATPAPAVPVVPEAPF